MDPFCVPNLYRSYTFIFGKRMVLLWCCSVGVFVCWAAAEYWHVRVVGSVCGVKFIFCG